MLSVDLSHILTDPLIPAPQVLLLEAEKSGAKGPKVKVGGDDGVTVGEDGV